jgi:2-dehydropantoate 2-reductase
MLARAGAAVTLFGRPGPGSPHLDALREHGLKIDGTEVRETIPVSVARDYRAIGSSELVLFCVKTLSTEQAAAAIRPHLRESAIVVSLQNGIDNVERLASEGVAALASVVFVAAAIETPGTVRHRGRGDLVLGGPERREDVERVAAWFERAGVPCPISDDLRRELWKKLILNSMANAISALTDASYRRLAEFAPTWQLARDIAAEAVAVARADGADLDIEEVVELGNSIVHSIGSATSSTQQDIANGRPTEIDSLNGYIARRGSEVGVATPVNGAVHALVKLREQPPGEPRTG